MKQKTNQVSKAVLDGIVERDFLGIRLEDIDYLLDPSKNIDEYVSTAEQSNDESRKQRLRCDLQNINLSGYNSLFVSIEFSKKCSLTMDELEPINEVLSQVKENVPITWSVGTDNSLGNSVSVSIFGERSM